jgi:hypothetical protein
VDRLCQDGIDPAQHGVIDCEYPLGLDGTASEFPQVYLKHGE